MQYLATLFMLRILRILSEKGEKRNEDISSRATVLRNFGKDVGAKNKSPGAQAQNKSPPFFCEVTRSPMVGPVLRCRLSLSALHHAFPFAFLLLLLNPLLVSYCFVSFQHVWRLEDIRMFMYLHRLALTLWSIYYGARHLTFVRW